MSRHPLLFFLCLVATFAPGPARIAVATDYFVNGATGDDSWDGLAPEWNGSSGPKATIQAGIDAASDTDTVTVADGTYTGDGNRDLDFGGKAITVRSANGPAACIIDCEGTEADPHRGFDFHSGEGPDSVILGFTIRRGLAAGASPEDGGGGIRVLYSGPSITQCVIVHSAASGNARGAGILCLGGSVIVTDSIIARNAATELCCPSEGGGGIACVDSDVTVSGCTVAANHAAEGAGILCRDSRVTISKCRLLSNSTFPGYGGGGGIACAYATVLISACDIRGNEGGDGGGARFYQSSVRIVATMLRDNLGWFEGGGIVSLGGEAVVENSTIVDNESNCGGAVASRRCIDLSFFNCTMTGNRATLCGGALHAGTESYCTLTDCILWGDEAGTGHEIAMSDATLTVRYCDVQGGEAEVYVGEGSVLDYDASNIDADPLFRDAANGDYRLRCWSPCIDAGTSDGAPERDIVGARRWDVPWVPNTGGGEMPWYDIGAYEFWPGWRWGRFRHHWRGWPWCWQGHGQGPRQR